MAVAAPRLGWRSSILFASGDLGCNLYWQSTTFYLLFFYTDLLGLSARAAGMITLVGSIFDGFAGLAIGWVAERRGSGELIRWGALPLALSFLLIYAPLPLGPGPGLIACALSAQILFRFCYAAVNIPYTAMTVQVARNSADRARIAGLRMIFGGTAIVLVGLATRAGIAIAGHLREPSAGFLIASAAAGVVATILLLRVSTMSRSPAAAPSSRARLPPGRLIGMILRNRAFVRINIGILGGTAAMSVLTRALPYYLKYRLGVEEAGVSALAMMGIAGVLAIPLWMACARRFGSQAQWQVSAAVAALALILLLLVQPASAVATGWLFVLFQIGGQGLFLGFWAILPDAVEHGGPTPDRADTFLFGVAALVQKIGPGAAAALFGLLLSASGYRTGAAQPPHVVHALLVIMAGLPLLGIATASLAMLRFPAAMRAYPQAMKPVTYTSN